MSSHNPDYYLREYGTDQLPLSLSVLQLEPADRAVLKIADERDAVQKKTFTKWINKHLLKAGRRVVDLYEDLRDGHNLISLLEVLAHESLPREKGRMRFHKIQNVQIAIEFLSKKGIRLVNIRSDEIVDGNPKLTLGLIWTIILHFQISDVVVSGQEDLSAKEALLLWSRRTVEGYPGVKISNFTNSWRDGRAFLSILHRHRPDLIDFHRVRSNSPRQNLEMAFSIAEQEFGVTRLLDPEDVDVPEPDEKSVLTYISSLYDVFPEVPSVEQTLKDNEWQLKVDEYRQLASSLISWLQESTLMMKNRQFPTTLIEMKTLLAECDKFKVEEVPPRLEAKKRLFQIYEEIQDSQRGAIDMAIPTEIKPDSMERFWNRFILQQQERDNNLQSEILRLERLQRQAEKVHRDCKHSEDSLEEIARRIREEQGRVDRIHPLEAKRNCDSIERSLHSVEDSVRSLFRDVQNLQEGHFATADQLYRRVSSIQSRVSELRTLLFGEVIQRLISKSYVEESSTLTKRKEVVTEIRLIETNPVFQHVQGCLNWIESQQKSLEDGEYGGDLNTVQALTKQHDVIHQEITNFRKEVEKCIANRRSLSGEEQKLYTEWLSKVEVAFSLLLNTSTRRSKCLESLQDFLTSATEELIWLNEKEELETSRDWSSPDQDMEETDTAYQSILRELENRETQFNSVQDRGSAMVLDRHPAAETIKAYMEALQSQWSWLIQLTVCLEQHLKFKTAYHQFFKECQTCEQDMLRQEEMLASRYSQDGLDAEEARQRVKELQALQKHLSDLEHQVSTLIHRSKEILPLKQRSEPVHSPVRIQCLCTYKQPELMLEKGMDCLLLDNSGPVRWKVRSSSGQEGNVPAVCFLIPPPNTQAIQQADRLKRNLEQILSQWKLQSRVMRYNMVLSTIKKVKSWDLKQFMLLDPSRRETFWRTLNDDTNLLISEMGESTPEMRHLREELADCNQIFLSLSASAIEQEVIENQSPELKFLQELDSLNHGLISCDQTYPTESYSWDRDSVRHAAEQHKAWERMLKSYESDLEQMNRVHATLPRKSHQVEVKYGEVVQRWEKLASLSQTTADRLRKADTLLENLELIRQIVTDYEITLVSHDAMSCDPTGVHNLHEELETLQISMQQNQPKLDQLREEVTSLSASLELPGYHNTENLEKEVRALGQRWDNIQSQISERLRSTEMAKDMLSHYTRGIKGEQTFVSEIQKAAESQPPLTYNNEELKRSIEPTMAIYNSLGEEQHQIEAVNRHGGQFIREAKGRLVDSCDKLVQDLNNELNWLSDTEQLLREDQPISDEGYKVQSQLQAQKALHDDIQKHQQPINALVYQTEQLLEHHQEELTPEQVTQLQQLSDSVKLTVGKVQKTSEARLKHLTTASSELAKFEAELSKFDDWLAESTKELERQEELISDLDNFNRVMEQQKELMNDLISHQADVRFMTMSTQKYMEEAKLHKLEVDAFKANRKRSSRVSWIGMEGMDAEMVGNKLKREVVKYDELSARCSAFGDKLASLHSKQRDFNESTFRLLAWLTDAEEKLSTSKQESATTDPEILREQLDTIKNLESGTYSQCVQLEELEKSSKDLVANLHNLYVSPAHITKFQEIINDIADRHGEVTKEINDLSNSIQTALTKSQDVEDALDNLLSWLRDVDSQLDNQRPISLSRDNLNDQYQEIKLIQADVMSHKPSIEAVRHDAHELIKTCELDMAKSLESRLSDLDKKFSAVQNKCDTRNKDMDEISETLSNFQDTLNGCLEWIKSQEEELEKKEWNKKSTTDMNNQINELTKQKDSKQKVVDELAQLGQLLIEDCRTGEVSAVKESMRDLNRHWQDFVEILGDRQQEAQDKERQCTEYEDSKKAIVEWLTEMENKVDSFQPVAIDVEVAERQVEELEPLLQEYQDYGPIIEEVNDAGFAFDATQNDPNRPQSPFRRMMRGRRFTSILSPKIGSPTFPYPSSPSPAGLLSPSSDSSGISSKKSSFENFQLEDLTEIQQELVDINQRYDILGERLADRHQELKNIIDSMKNYLENMHELLTWIDLKELDMNIQGSLPTSEREAKKKLKEQEEFHRELLDKENLVTDIRAKGHDLLRAKQGVTGMKEFQQQLVELDNKWLDVKVVSEQRRKSLEDMVSNIHAFKDAGVHLQKWIAQKEKMVAVLGPIATDKAMIQNQQQQVEVLTEELKSQAPLYESFIQSGHAILDLCEAESKDASHISQKMDIISKDWDRLRARLQDRGTSLTAVQGLSAEFNDSIDGMLQWTSTLSEKMKELTPATFNPEENKVLTTELQSMESELEPQNALLQKSKDLHKKLADVIKDPNTKTELKQKIANVEKQLVEAEKQIACKMAEIDQVSTEGAEFTASCHSTLDWASEVHDRLNTQQPISGKLQALQHQAQQQQLLMKEIHDHGIEVQDLIQKSRDILKNSPPSKHTQDMEDTIEAVKAEYEELKETAGDRDQKIHASLQLAQRFHDELDKLLLWLEFSEEKCKSLDSQTLQKDKLVKKLSDAQGLKAEISQHKQHYDHVIQEGEALSLLVETDQGIVNDAVSSASSRWESLSKVVDDKVQELEDLLQKVEEFHDNMRDVNAMLDKCGETLHMHNEMGPASKAPKHQDKIKLVQEEVDGVLPQIDYLEAILEELSDSYDGKGDLMEEFENARNKHTGLQKELGELLLELDEGTQIVREFQEDLSSVTSMLTAMEGELNSVKPIRRDESALVSQLRETEEILSKLNDAEGRISDIEGKGKDLAVRGYITDPKVTENSLEALKDHHKNAKTNAEELKSEIGKMIDQLERVNDNLRRTRTSVDRASSELDMHEPIGTDIAGIRRQQEELQMFMTSVFEPLQKRVEDASRGAEELMRSAAASVNTSELETDHEMLLEKWADLKKKVSEREHNLDNSLLQAGKFHDAIDHLLGWLKETEETVANQKPPSPEYKIAKAQDQEQKFLMKMLEDRSPNVKSAKNAADSLMKGLDPREQKGIQNQIAQLDHRWNAICSSSQERAKALDAMLGLAKDFQDVHEPLATWLDVMEKKFASLEPSAMDTQGIENIITALKDMEEEVESKTKDVKDLALKGKDVQDVCKGNDVKTLQQKIDAIQGRFTELREKVIDSTEQMEEALPIAKNFNEAHAAFLDWVLKVESQLRAKEATGPEAEEQVLKFLEKLQEVQPVVEVLREDGGNLADLAPGDAGLKVEETSRKDLQRYDSVSEQIQRRAQKMQKSKQRSSEIVGDMTDLLEWFEDKAQVFTEPPHIVVSPEILETQVGDHKSMNDEISKKKSDARDLITRGKKMLRESSLEDDPRLRETVEALKNKSDQVAKVGQERLRLLEQALPLAKHFQETDQDLKEWFVEVKPIMKELQVLSIDADQVKKQQEQVKVLKQEVQDHKPDIDRLNKTGSALIKLCNDQDGQKVQQILNSHNSDIEEMKNSLKDRSLSIDEALQQSAEFTDKLEDILDTLTLTEDMMKNAEPISAHPDKIKEQLADNKAVMEDIDTRQSALASIKSTAEELIKQASNDQDLAVQDVKQKLQELVQLYDKICDSSLSRTKDLEDTLEVSEKFWEDYQTLNQTVKDLQDQITSQEPPALEPAIIREQQDFLEVLKEDIESTEVDLEDFHTTGEQLFTLIGEPEKPEVQKNIEDLDTQMVTMKEEFEKRAQGLEEALEKAVHFQDELMKILVWLQKREVRLREFTPVGSDFDTIKVQWNQIKELKSDVEPKQVDIESLNQKGQDLAKDAVPADQVVVKEPLSSVNRRWDNLLEGIGQRQRNLQLAMLNVGQFEHALNELLAWLDKTDESIDDMTLPYGDPKRIEIELAKLKIIQNDIDAHRESVDSVKDAGQRVLATEHGAETPVKRKLADVNELWDKIQKKSADKFKHFKNALREAKSFSGDLQDLLLHLSDLEGNLIVSSPVGGLPETAKEQLEKFMSVLDEIDKTDSKVAKSIEDGEILISKSPDLASKNIKQNLELLKQRWNNIQLRAQDKKKKLEDAVGQADNFHKNLNEFIQWLTETEKTLNNLQPVSRVLEYVTQQIQDQKVLQKDISSNRERMISLDKTGTHLKYFSQKQDVILIRNLLSSVQHRWEKIVSRTAERTRHLERGYKEAKQFFLMWKDMMDWLQESEKTIDADQTVSNDHSNIKLQIIKHKEFQRSLGARQPMYDSVNRMGRSLKDKSPDLDKAEIEKKMSMLKAKWNNLCAKSVDRQRKLEEALLFAGQFSEALQALLDWLSKVEPTLLDDQPVYGDIYTVNNLMELHKTFQHELGARSNTVAFVRKRAKEMLDKSEHDMSQQQAELIELSTMWDRVCKLSVNKQEKLEQAHKLAEDFHQKGQALLDWLASTERQLRYRGALPDEEIPLLKQIEEHKKFEEELMRQEANLRETLSIGQDILKRCHPDALTTLKHWLSVLRARWEELTGMCKQRGIKLAEGLSTMRRNNAILDDLMAWLNGAEGTLMGLDQEPIPGDLQVIADLLKDHQDFQNEMSGKQPDVDRLTKGDRRRTTSTSEPISQIPVLKGSMSGRQTPVKRTPRKDSGRRTPEPIFKNPRVGALFMKWRTVWLMAMDRHRKLQDAMDYLSEVERLKDFKFDDWRRRYLQWMRHNKSRIMDLFRRQDRDRDGRVTRKEFIDGIIATKFPTSQLEMETVANMFDRDGSGLIDYKEFVTALRPDREPQRPITDAEKITDEVKNAVSKCTCVKQFKIHKIGEGKYRFGDSQKLRLVRILRSTVMVRVGGGWVALDEFLVKNDPCRAKGRTNVELREQFILAQGVSQSMSPFVSKSPSGSSHSGSSTYSGTSWSTRSPSSATGPITKIREKTQYPSPWKQNGAKASPGPDVEVRQIMSGADETPKRSKFSRSLRSPRDVFSPAIPPSGRSSRASTGSRPSSRADSECSDTSEPDIYTTVQKETRNLSGRKETTLTYQTHVVKTKTLSAPSPTIKGSKIPKPSPARKK